MIAMAFSESFIVWYDRSNLLSVCHHGADFKFMLCQWIGLIGTISLHAKLAGLSSAAKQIELRMQQIHLFEQVSLF